MRLRVSFWLGICLVSLAGQQCLADKPKSPIDDGSMIISGAATLASLNGEAYDGWFRGGSSLFTFSVALSGFVRPGLAVGYHLQITRMSQDQYEFEAYAIGPRVSYYFGSGSVDKEVSGEAFPFASLGYSYGSAEGSTGRENPITIYAEEHSLHSIQITAGLTYLLTSDIGMTTELTNRLDFFDFGEDEFVGGHRLSVTLGFTMFVW